MMGRDGNAKSYSSNEAGTAEYNKDQATLKTAWEKDQKKKNKPLTKTEMKQQEKRETREKEKAEKEKQNQEKVDRKKRDTEEREEKKKAKSDEKKKKDEETKRYNKEQRERQNKSTMVGRPFKKPKLAKVASVADGSAGEDTSDSEKESTSGSETGKLRETRQRETEEDGRDYSSSESDDASYIRTCKRYKQAWEYRNKSEAEKAIKGAAPSGGWTLQKQLRERSGKGDSDVETSSGDSDDDSVYQKAADEGKGPNGSGVWSEEDKQRITNAASKQALIELRELAKIWTPEDSEKRTVVTTTLGTGEFQHLSLDKKKLGDIEDIYKRDIEEGLNWSDNKPRRKGNSVQFGPPARFPIYLNKRDEGHISRDQVPLHELQSALAAEFLNKFFPAMGWKSIYLAGPSENTNAPMCNTTSLGDRVDNNEPKEWFLKQSDDLAPSYDSKEGSAIYRAPNFPSNAVGLATTLHLHRTANASEWNPMARRLYIEQHHLDCMCDVNLMMQSNAWLGLALRDLPLEMHNKIDYVGNRANSLLSNTMTAFRMATSAFPSIRNEPNRRTDMRDYNNPHHWAVKDGAPANGKKGLGLNIFMQVDNLDEAMLEGPRLNQRNKRVSRAVLGKGTTPSPFLIAAMGLALGAYGGNSDPSTIAAIFGFSSAALASVADKLSWETAGNTNSTEHAKASITKGKLAQTSGRLKSTTWSPVLDISNTIVDIEPERLKGETEAFVKGLCMSLNRGGNANFYDIAVKQQDLEAATGATLAKKYSTAVVEDTLEQLTADPKMLENLDPTAMLRLMNTLGASLVYDSVQKTANLTDVKNVMANGVFAKSRRIEYDTRKHIMFRLNPTNVNTSQGGGGYITDLIVQKIIGGEVADDIIDHNGHLRNRKDKFKDSVDQAKLLGRRGFFERPPSSTTDGYDKKKKGSRRGTLSDDDGLDSDGGVACRKPSPPLDAEDGHWQKKRKEGQEVRYESDEDGQFTKHRDEQRATDQAEKLNKWLLNEQPHPASRSRPDEKKERELYELWAEKAREESDHGILPKTKAGRDLLQYVRFTRRPLAGNTKTYRLKLPNFGSKAYKSITESLEGGQHTAFDLADVFRVVEFVVTDSNNWRTKLLELHVSNLPATLRTTESDGHYDNIDWEPKVIRAPAKSGGNLFLIKAEKGEKREKRIPPPRPPESEGEDDEDDDGEGGGHGNARKGGKHDNEGPTDSDNDRRLGTRKNPSGTGSKGGDRANSGGRRREGNAPGKSQETSTTFDDESRTGTKRPRSAGGGPRQTSQLPHNYRGHMTGAGNSNTSSDESVDDPERIREKPTMTGGPPKNAIVKANGEYETVPKTNKAQLSYNSNVIAASTGSQELNFAAGLFTGNCDSGRYLSAMVNKLVELKGAPYVKERMETPIMKALRDPTKGPWRGIINCNFVPIDRVVSGDESLCWQMFATKKLRSLRWLSREHVREIVTFIAVLLGAIFGLSARKAFDVFLAEIEDTSNLKLLIFDGKYALSMVFTALYEASRKTLEAIKLKTATNESTLVVLTTSITKSLTEHVKYTAEGKMNFDALSKIVKNNFPVFNMEDPATENKRKRETNGSGEDISSDSEDDSETKKREAKKEKEKARKTKKKENKKANAAAAGKLLLVHPTPKGSGGGGKGGKGGGNGSNGGSGGGSGGSTGSGGGGGGNPGTSPNPTGHNCRYHAEFLLGTSSRACGYGTNCNSHHATAKKPYKVKDVLADTAKYRPNDATALAKVQTALDKKIADKDPLFTG